MKDTVIITERRNGTLVLLTKKPLRKTESIQYKGRTFPVDQSRPFYTHRRKTYYLLDVKEGQLVTGGEPSQLPHELLDELLTRQVARQLVGSMSTSLLSGQLLPIILGVAVGLPCGIIAGGYI